MKQAIYCFWHNRLALCVKIYFQFSRAHHTAPGVAGLVSASKDGAFLSAIFHHFGVQPVRGSSSRRGAQALIELNSWAQRGYDLAITPDGPRGPRYVLAEGAITLAQITGLPLVPSSHHFNWKFSLNSWDKFKIPLPFARCDIFLGRPLLKFEGLRPDQNSIRRGSALEKRRQIAECLARLGRYLDR